MSSSQECVAVLQRMLDDVRGIGRVCATNVIYAAGEQDQALTAAIDALQRQGSMTLACHRLETPNGKWQWMHGEPSLGTLDLAKAHGYTIHYAYALPPQPPTGEQTS